MTSLTRRTALQGAMGLGVTAALTSTTHAATNSPTRSAQPDFNDPLTILRTHVKLVGSLGKEVVHSFMRLNIYADLGEGNFVPLFTMNIMLVDFWEPKEDNQHEMRKYEVGFYTRHDSYEPLEYFDSPITGQRMGIHHFKLGPVPRMYTPQGVIAMGYTPKLLPIETIGDRVYLATESIENRPDIIRPGKISYTNSFMTMSAPLAEVADPKCLSASTSLQLQNKNRWAPWMGMEERPGGTVARGFGTKIRNLEALPQPVKDGIRKYVPEILDTANWHDFVFEDTEYLKQQGR